MPQISIKDQVKKLVDLQKIDLEKYNLEKDIREKPEQVAILKEDFEKNKADLHNLEEKFKANQISRRSLELDMKSKEDLITKSNSQLSEMKTNKEYSTKMAEIESFKADKSVIEEKILISYDEADVITAEISKERAVVQEKEKEFLAKKKEVEDQIKVSQDRVNVLLGQRQQITPDIDKSVLSRYDAVLKHKEGLAIAPLKDMICGGCFMSLNPQTINALKMHDQLVSCEMCMRILYLEDDF